MLFKIFYHEREGHFAKKKHKQSVFLIKFQFIHLIVIKVSVILDPCNVANRKSGCLLLTNLKNKEFHCYFFAKPPKVLLFFVLPIKSLLDDI